MLSLTVASNLEFFSLMPLNSKTKTLSTAQTLTQPKVDLRNTFVAGLRIW